MREVLHGTTVCNAAKGASGVPHVQNRGRTVGNTSNAASPTPNTGASAAVQHPGAMRTDCTSMQSETAGEEDTRELGERGSTDVEIVIPGERPPKGVKRGERSGEHGGVELKIRSRGPTPSCAPSFLGDNPRMATS